MPWLFQVPLKCSTMETVYKLDQAEMDKIRLHYGGEVKQAGELSGARSPQHHYDLCSPGKSYIVQCQEAKL